MRTTLDIDEDVLQTAKELAAMRKTTAGKILSELARRGMKSGAEARKSRNGVPLLAGRRGEKLVTSEAVNQLRDDELE